MGAPNITYVIVVPFPQLELGGEDVLLQDMDPVVLPDDLLHVHIGETFS